MVGTKSADGPGVPPEVEALLESGNEALRAGRWPAARAAFEAALEQEDPPEALFGLGHALWWLGDVEASARAAPELAREFGDADLELCALSEIGAWLVELGRVEEGVALLDEAMAASLGGEGESLNSVVYTSCHTIISCSRAIQLERAAEWVRAIDAFSNRYGCPFVSMMCRTLYGGVLFATGQWACAENELQSALRMSATADRALHGEALAKLAELRVAQGRIEEAERLLAGFEDHSAAAPVVGAIFLARGEFVAALAIADRWLGVLGERSLESAPLLELRTDAELAAGAVREAAVTARRLAALGEELSCESIAARGRRALGGALAATGDRAAARRQLEAALLTFTRLDMPLEAARTHARLAETLREDRREHHVARVLRKLGRSRAEAAAYAARSPQRNSATN